MKISDTKVVYITVQIKCCGLYGTGIPREDPTTSELLHAKKTSFQNLNVSGGMIEYSESIRQKESFLLVIVDWMQTSVILKLMRVYAWQTHLRKGDRRSCSYQTSYSLL